MKFELKHSDSLSIIDFEKHEVWAQYYSADEIEHIVNEGYTKSEVERKLEEVDWSDDFWFRTNHSKDTTPYMFTRFKAQFELPNQEIVKGYIECTGYAGIQSYCLFVNEGFIGLNVQHPDMTEEEELELKALLNLNKLYPIRIESFDKQLSLGNYSPMKEDNKHFLN